MTSTTTYKPGEIVVVDVPFSDHSGSKPRPALVVSSARFHERLRDLVVCPISSQPRYFRRPGSGDYPLREWRTLRLRHPSTVRVSKILAVDRRIVRRVLSKLSPAALSHVRDELARAFELAKGSA